MELVVTPPASEFVHERGGRLYVWMRKSRCCGGGFTLATSTTPPRDVEFRLVEEADGIEVYVPLHQSRLPGELHVDLHRLPLRVQAYWNGCAFVA